MDKKDYTIVAVFLTLVAIGYSIAGTGEQSKMPSANDLFGTKPTKQQSLITDAPAYRLYAEMREQQSLVDPAKSSAKYECFADYRTVGSKGTVYIKGGGKSEEPQNRFSNGRQVQVISNFLQDHSGDPCAIGPCISPLQETNSPSPELFNNGSTFCVGTGIGVPGVSTGVVHCSTIGSDSEICTFVSVATPLIGPTVSISYCPQSATKSYCLGVGVNGSIAGAGSAFCLENSPKSILSGRFAGGGNAGSVFGSITAPPIIDIKRQ